MSIHSRIVGAMEGVCLGLAAPVMIAVLLGFKARATESVREHPQPVARMVAVDQEVRI